MFNCSYAVSDLLPHAPPMVLLDEVVCWERGNEVSASITIHAQSPFFLDNNGVPSYVGLEYMAQTCGIYAGLEALAHNRPVRLGFLLGTRNFHASLRWFERGEKLFITARKVLHEDTMGVFDCRIRNAEAEIVSAQLNLYQPDDQKTESLTGLK